VHAADRIRGRRSWSSFNGLTIVNTGARRLFDNLTVADESGPVDAVDARI
jgi:hypothetical protein